MHRVIYVIDHQRPGRDRWSKPEAATISIEHAGDEAARAIAERYGLRDAPAVQSGSRIRVRVWPEPAGLDELLAHDPDTEPAAGTWIYDPKDAR